MFCPLGRFLNLLHKDLGGKPNKPNSSQCLLFSCCCLFTCCCFSGIIYQAFQGGLQITTEKELKPSQLKAQAAAAAAAAAKSAASSGTGRAAMDTSGDAGDGKDEKKGLALILTFAAI